MFGEMISKLTTVIFFKWVGSTTNYSWCLALVWRGVFDPSNMECVDFSASKDQMLLVYNQTLEMTEKILSKQGSSNYPFWGNQNNANM